MNQTPIEVHTVSSSSEAESEKWSETDDEELLSLEALLSPKHSKKQKTTSLSNSYSVEEPKPNVENEVISLDDSSNSGSSYPEISQTTSSLVNAHTRLSHHFDSDICYKPDFRRDISKSNGHPEESLSDDELENLPEFAEMLERHGADTTKNSKSIRSYKNLPVERGGFVKTNIISQTEMSEDDVQVYDLNDPSNEDNLDISLFSRCKNRKTSMEISPPDNIPDLGVDKLPDVFFGCLSSSEKDSLHQHEEVTVIPTGFKGKERIIEDKSYTPCTKLEEARQYALKNVTSAEALKYLKVIMDEKFIEGLDGTKLDVIINRFQNEKFEISYEIKEQIIGNSITWMRAYNTNVSESENNSDARSMQWTDEDQVFVILHVKELLPMIDAYKQKDRKKHNCKQPTLVEYTASIQPCLQNKKITYIICSAENYFRQQKAKHTKQSKNNILGIEPSQPRCKKNSRNNTQTMNITEVDMEEVIVDLELRIPDCNVHFVKDSANELADLIVYFSKAIAQLPFKIEKNDQFSWFLGSENRACVKVDKSGKFISELWMAQIQSFANVGVDTSEAIVSQYPTPQSLLQAYHQSRSAKNAQILLENIMVRRQAGPFSTSRRIGPELSKKIHAFFTSTDGDKLLHNL